MAEEKGKPSSLKEKAGVLGLKLSITPPVSDKDTGIIVVRGPKQQCKDLVEAMGITGGQFESRYMKDFQLRDDLKRLFRPGCQSLDLGVTGPDGDMQQIRLLVDEISEGNWEVSIGRGGNYTTLEEMKASVRKAIDHILTPPE